MRVFRAASVFHWQDGPAARRARCREEAGNLTATPDSSDKNNPFDAHNPYRAGSTTPAVGATQEPGWVPYRNGAALVAYYTGLFSLIGLVPLLGIPMLVLAPVAIWYGYQGLASSYREPQRMGGHHARLGLLLAMIVLVVGIPLQAYSAVTAWDLMDQAERRMTEPLGTD
jgi:hypothetical protein